MRGVFASTAWNPAANGGVNGLLAGDSSFVSEAARGRIVSSVWAFVFTYGILWIIIVLHSRVEPRAAR
jgi:Amt family ammonium transporter